jgi:hypothetical protein
VYNYIITVNPSYQVTFNYQVSGGGSGYSTPSVTYTSLGLPQTVTAGPSATVWADSGSTYTYTPNPLTGSSGNERWQASAGTSGTISSSATIAPNYYHQYMMNLSYSVSGGGLPTAPTFTANRFGSSTPVTLTGSLTGSWFDAGASWTVTNPLTGSSSTERWATSTGSGTVSAAATIAFAYYHQYSITPYYTVSDSSSPSVTNVVSYTQFGSPLTVTPTLGSSGGSAVWVDAGTAVTYTSPIPGGSGERWQVASGDSGTHTAISSVSSSTSATVEYYHQYQVTASYSTSDSSTPSASVTLSGTQFGSSSYTLTLTTSSQTPWLVAETGWSVNNPFTAGSGTERWDAASGISGNVIGAITINPIYVHQYYLAVISTYGSPSGSGWYSSGSTAYASVASNTVSGGSGIQYVLTGWGGDSSGSGTTSNGITMYAPKTATASWGTQYYLTVTSPYGSPSTASGWFNAGTNINEAVTSSVPVAAGTQYVCTGWTGTGSITSSGNTP